MDGSSQTRTPTEHNELALIRLTIIATRFSFNRVINAEGNCGEMIHCAGLSCIFTSAKAINNERSGVKSESARNPKGQVHHQSRAASTIPRTRLLTNNTTALTPLPRVVRTYTADRNRRSFDVTLANLHTETRNNLPALQTQ